MSVWQKLAVWASAGILGFSSFCARAREPTVVGWRGDGSGKYLSAEPPTTWSRVSTVLRGLRFLAGAPTRGEPGTPMPDGVIRQWLILGPVPIPEEARLEEDTLRGESQFAPQAGQETGGRTWKKVQLDTAYLDFATLLGPPGPAVAYACTYV